MLRSQPADIRGKTIAGTTLTGMVLNVRLVNARAAVLSSPVGGSVHCSTPLKTSRSSRLMGQDEIGTLRQLTFCRAILDERIAAYRGRIFGSAGDSVVADFASAVDAVQCAVAVQDALANEEQMRFRIGVHVGDVIAQGDNLFGDGVNIAARLE